jgi:hypothetical protein
VYWSAVVVVLVPAAVLTRTWILPAGCAGARAFSRVLETKVTDGEAVAPNLTVAPRANPVPVMVIVLPPAFGPELGLTFVTFGSAGICTEALALLVGPCPFVAVTLHTRW